MTARLTSIAVALGHLIPLVVEAQDETQHRRSGFTWGFSVGQASLGYICGPGVDRGVPDPRPCGSDGRAAVGIGHATAGWAISPSLTVGLSTDGWNRSGQRESGSTHSLSVHLYPGRASGFFVTAGAGVSASYIHQTEAPSLAGRGWGAAGGVGFDIPVDRGYSLMLQLRVIYGEQGFVGPSFVDHDGTVLYAWRTGVHESAVGISLGLRFH